MSTESEGAGHGHSPAAWTAVIIMLAGVTIGTVAFFFEIVWIVLASIGVVVVGLLVGFVLAKLGYGVNGSRYAAGAGK